MVSEAARKGPPARPGADLSTSHISAERSMLSRLGDFAAHQTELAAMQQLSMRGVITEAK